MLKQVWEVKHLTWGIPPKIGEVRPNFPEDIKLFIGLPKQPLLELSPPVHSTSRELEPNLFTSENYDKIKVEITKEI